MRFPGVLVITPLVAVQLVAAQEPTNPSRPDPTAQATTAVSLTPFASEHVTGIPWRSIGPANMAGRITDIEVPRESPTTWYVASAGGGLWKTQNCGISWEALFQHQPTASIGDVAVAPTNPEIVWVGTGEENARNSVQWGDGIYKSTDAGKTWKHMGLEQTFQIGHIAIHPQDSTVVFVAALGRLWGRNPERGVYRTKNGGESWERVFYLDDQTGCVDVRIDPQHPRVVYAAMYERARDGFDSNDPAVRFGAKSGIYRSDDGGDTWKRLTQGLPTCKWGRTGLCLWEQSPDTVFAIIETERSGWASGTDANTPSGPPVNERSTGLEGEDAEGGAKLTAVTGESPADKAGLKPGDLITRVGDERVNTWQELRAAVRQGTPGEKCTFEVSRGDEKLELEVAFVAEEPRPRRGTLGIQGEDADGGAALTNVTEDGAGAKAGLRTGDVVTRVNDTAIATYFELVGAMRRARAGEKAKFVVLRNDKPQEVEVTYGEPAGEDVIAMFGNRLGGQRANLEDQQGPLGYETGGVFRSDDRGETWRRLNSLTERPFYYSKIVVDPRSDQHIYCTGISLWASHDGGKKFAANNRGIHVDFHAVWVHPQDSDHLLVGGDGGVNVTWDRCRSFEVLNNFVVGQFYHVDVDQSVPYRVYGGLQDNGTWGGPSRTRFREGATLDDWVQIYQGDGFGAQCDPTDPYTVYATSQNGGLGRVDLRTGATSPVQKRGDNRFNWDTPFKLSPHNHRILWFAGQHVHRSLDQGRRSQKLTTQPLGLTDRGTATAIAESPAQAGVVYVGTDDGALWRSKDWGTTWTAIHANIQGLPGPRYISAIHPSRTRPGRVYVAMDGHRSDDFDAHLYVSEDYGERWTWLAADLPNEPVHVCREDPTRQDLLFAGTEFGCYVSLDRGQHWLPVGKNLPTVAVRDLVIQDRDSDLVAATHGRGLWILDIAPLRQLTAEVAKKPVHLFAPEAATLWRTPSREGMSPKQWRAENPPNGVVAYALFATAPAEPPVLTIHDISGKEVGRATGTTDPGIQRFVWEARRGRDRLEPGAYSIRFEHGKDKLIQPLTLVADPQDLDPGAASSSIPGSGS